LNTRAIHQQLITNCHTTIQHVNKLTAIIKIYIK